MKVWLSCPSIGSLRPGILVGPKDFRLPRLPSRRRHEYREALKAWAAKHSRTMTIADCDYLIDKAVAFGELDVMGPVIYVKGTREQIVSSVLERSAAWNIPMTRAEAERLTDRTIRDIKFRRWSRIALTTLLLLAATFILLAIIGVANAS